LRFWWPAYLFGFIMLTRTLPRLEWTARDSLMSTGALVAAALIAAALLRVFHRRPYPAPSFDIETFVEAERVLRLE
jgi:hypothetical protein